MSTTPNVPVPLRLSEHAYLQACRRRIPLSHISLAVERGTRIYQDDGATLHHLGRRMLPSELPHSLAARLEGTTVVRAHDGAVITVYRTHRIPRLMRRRGRPRRRRF